MLDPRAGRALWPSHSKFEKVVSETSSDSIPQAIVGRRLLKAFNQFDEECFLERDRFARKDFLDNKMADRFPSLEENFDLPGAGDGEDFLARERATVGDEFSTSNDHATTSATVEDGEDDLLEEGSFEDHHARAEGVTEFESSFPAIDTQNEV